MTEEPLERKNLAQLHTLWKAELNQLAQNTESLTAFHWPALQERLEGLHALAREIFTRSAQERAKWQP